MAKPKKVKPSVRMDPDVHDELVKRAAASNMTLTEYLIACGLADERRPDKHTVALRERAVYELHEANDHLARLTPERTARSGKTAFLKALGAVTAAAQLLARTYLPLPAQAARAEPAHTPVNQAALFVQPGTHSLEGEEHVEKVS